MLLHEIEFFSAFGITLVLFFSISFFSYLESIAGVVAGEATDAVTVTVIVVPALSLNSPADAALAPTVEETGGSATGNVTWTVQTGNAEGWRLDLNASGSPALTSGGNSFADYTEAFAGVPEAWSIDASDSEFGFNSSGTYAEAGFSGSKYLGFNGTNLIQAAHRDAPSDGGGDDTTVNFRAEVGTLHTQSTGTYSAVITATATTL